MGRISDQLTDVVLQQHCKPSRVYSFELGEVVYLGVDDDPLGSVSNCMSPIGKRSSPFGSALDHPVCCAIRSAYIDSSR